MKETNIILNLPQVHEKVVSLIPNPEAEAVKSNQLMEWTGLSFRVLKEVITDLRNHVLIVAKENEGGGYWIAENMQGVIRYVEMLTKRRYGYTRTINTMKRYLRF